LKKITLLFAISILNLFIIFLPDIVISSQYEKGGEERLFGLADYFMKIGEYSQAIKEYRRFIYLYPESSMIEDALFRIGEAYLLMGSYQEAISFLRETINTRPEWKYLLDSKILIGRGMMALKRLKEAREILYEVIQSASPPASEEIKWKALYFLAESFVMEEKWDDAIKVLERTDLKGPFRWEAERYISHLRGIDQIPFKSPEVAGLLSALLPGAGHLYCQRSMDAMTAFLINSAFIAGAIEAFQKKQKGLGIALSSIEVIIYSGTIFSAVTSAHKFNRDEKRKYLDHIKIRIGHSHEKKGIFLSLSILF
jgi:tetratricopeptide (TPR) repeat protein